MNILYIILIFIVIGFLVFYILPALLPVILIIFAFSVIRNFFVQKKQQNYFEETFKNQNSNDYTYTQNQSRVNNSDVIDAEYTERDIEE